MSKIILFGSVARGTKCKDSDIDIVVISDGNDKYVHKGIYEINII